MGKATELYDYLVDNPREKETPRYPELRLRADIPRVIANNSLRAGLERIGGSRDDSPCVVVTDQDAGLQAVMIRVEDYLELIAMQLMSSNDAQVGSDGVVRPTGLTSSAVEQVDQQAAWPTRSDSHQR